MQGLFNQFLLVTALLHLAIPGKIPPPRMPGIGRVFSPMLRDTRTNRLLLLPQATAFLAKETSR